MPLIYHVPLDADQQAAEGIDPAQPLAIADKVRFAELDSQNHVNNKAYLTWFESLRIAYFDHLCAPVLPVPEKPRIMLRSIDVRFHREMTMGESYVCTARVSSFRRHSYAMTQQIWAGGTLRATADLVVVTDRPDGSGRWALPEALRAAFAARDGARDER